MFFANVVPRSLRAIPWGWTNETHSIDAPGLPSKMTFVAKPLGWIEMPVDLASFFDWTTFLVEQVEQEKLWGT